MSAVASTAAASGCVSLRAQGPRSAAPTGRAARLAVRRNAVQTESKSSKAEPSEDEIFE